MTAVETPSSEPRPPDRKEEGHVARGGALRLALVTLGVIALGLFAGASWLVIIGALTVIIFLHELGHYLTAKWAGMKVTEFFLGFGPRVWSFRRGETEYGLKAIPAGAYVKVIGMYNLDDVDPAEEHRTYRQKKWHQRVIMASAGSAMHFIMAFGLIFAILVGSGAPVGGHLFTEPDLDRWEVGRISDGSAAFDAGLERGDRLVSVAGEPVTSFEGLRDIVRNRKDETVAIVFVRDGVEQTATATIQEHTQRRGEGMLGVGARYETERMGAVAAVPAAGREFGALVGASVSAMGRLFTPSGMSDFFSQVADGGRQPATGEPGGGATTPEDAENRLISIYGAARIGAGLLDEGIAPFLGLLIILNVFIGLFNLVPLLPLDGGHIAVATYERIRELFRRDGRRYFVDVTKLMPLTYAVVLLMVLIGVSALYLDIVNPIELP